ncbi:MAG: hydrogenase expression/formation C-terminal domain-containing protein [Gammaproteobacteria bacterium]|jgi:hydrogenase-1 operon protein HyaF
MPDSVKSQFNIQIGNELTWNVQPLLHEIRHALRNLLETGHSSIIDLRSIPLAPGEEETILDTLGCGEVHAKLNALGPSEIYETRFAGVWLVTHFNTENDVIGRFIEITRFPGILESQREDMATSLDLLEQTLEDRPGPDETETHAETN